MLEKNAHVSRAFWRVRLGDFDSVVGAKKKQGAGAAAERAMTRTCVSLSLPHSLAICFCLPPVAGARRDDDDCAQ